MTKMNLQKTKTSGEYLRTLRENAGYTLKHVSESIGVDISLLAKFERNERQPSKSLIKLFSIFFKCDERELLNQFLSDQIAYKIIDEDADVSILKVAEMKVKYLKTLNNGK